MKKGISLIVLMITLIIMVIFTGIIIFSSNSAVITGEKAKLQMDIAQLEALMNTYKFRKNGNIDFGTVEFNTSTLSAEELMQFEGETIANNSIELYIIELSEIDAEAVSYGNLELGVSDRYLYSDVTGKVYYEKGLEIDNITYYYSKNGER